MAIKDLEARQGQVDIIVEVIEKGDVREFEKFGKRGRVCNAKIKDNTGEMTLTLWNEQTAQVNAGDKVHIINGWVSEWQGEKQLSTGKFGQLEIVEEGGERRDEAEDKAETKIPSKKKREAKKDKVLRKDEGIDDEETEDKEEGEEPYEEEWEAKEEDVG